MNNDRRKVLKGTGGMAVMGLAVSAGLFKPGSAWAQGWNKAAFEARRAELEMHQADAFGKAQARAEKMSGATVQILAKAGEEGKLFGSIGTADIAEAMTQAGFPLERAEIHLPAGPLKQIGDFEIPVSLHTEVNFSIHVSVVAEK